MLFKTQINTDKEKTQELFTRRIEAVFPSKDEAIKKLEGGERLRVYLGIDPTGPDLHLGHTVPLLFLKQLLELGHRPVLVLGDFTARIGDPTGKETARKPLTEKEIKENMKNYLGQVYKILPKGSFDVEYNSKWLAKMSFKDLIELSSHVTVQQMIARDMFQERIKNEKPIGLNEFMYPLMQGYDSVAMKIDGEAGGNDQIFNMLVGRDLEKKLLNKDKLVFATRLLVDAESGKKMSKTEGGLISLSDSAQDMFGKTMKTVPDEMIARVFELCTEKPTEWILDKKEQGPYEFKKDLAFELVRMYHGEKEAQKAKEEFERVFSKGEKPEKIVEVENKGNIIQTSVATGMVESNSEMKRLVDQKAVQVNDVVIEKWDHPTKSGDIVKIGPRKFYKVK
ncbi:MAG: tyrosine--tRNA ligase [bacterium]|nr:tyrosine--tRNA ligase [bacterium]